MAGEQPMADEQPMRSFLKRHWRRWWQTRHNHQFCRLQARNLAAQLYAQATRVLASPPVAPGTLGASAGGPPLAQIEPLPAQISKIIEQIDAQEDCGSSYPKLLAWQPLIFGALPDADREQIFLELCRDSDKIYAAQQQKPPKLADRLKNADGVSPSADQRVAARDAAAISLMERLGQHNISLAEKNMASDRANRKLLSMGATVVLVVLAEFAAIAFLAVNWPLEAGYATGTREGIVGLCMICLMGVLGSFTSTMARLQKTLGSRAGAVRLPLADLDSLARSGMSVGVSLWSGSVFALMAYFLFSSGAAGVLGFKDGLFPVTALSSEFAISALGTGYRPHVSYPWIIEAGRHSPFFSADLTEGIAGQPPVAAASGVPGAACAVPKPARKCHSNGDGHKRHHGKRRHARRAATLSCPTPSPAATAAPILPVPLPTATPTAVPIAYNQPDAPGSPPPPATKPADPACIGNVGPACGQVAVIASRLGLFGAADLFKILVWAFLAGFAERMLPDVIDRVLKRNMDAFEGPNPTATAVQETSGT